MLSVLLAMIVLQAGDPPAADRYREPPEEIVALVDAPPPPRVEASPDARWLLFVERASLPTIAELARPWLPLAGLRIDPQIGALWRASYDRSLKLVELGGDVSSEPEESAEPTEAGAPAIADISWSHGSRQVAFTARGESSLDLWIVDVSDKLHKRVVSGVVAVFDRGFEWMPDGRRLLVRILPPDRGAPPQRPGVPVGPRIQFSEGELSPVATYQDLLRDEHDEALFEHYARSQLVLVDPRDGSVRPIGEPRLFTRATPSPDGNHILVECLERPFSYVLPHWRFPRSIEVWSAEGALEHVAAKVPLGEGIPLGGVRIGPREMDWHAKDPSTLIWVEALDGGDPKRQVERRDRLVQHAPPWSGPPVELWQLAQRFTSLLWMPEGDAAFVGTYDRERNSLASELFSRTDPAAKQIVFEQRNVRDRYGDPGTVLREHTTLGTVVARVDGRWIYRAGNGASRQGDRPFLDRQNLDTLASERLWRCMPGAYEQVLALVTSGTQRLPSFLTSYESPTEPQNVRLRDLQEQGTVRALTSFESPSPKLARISQRLLTYEREDGVSLSARLYLPPDWSESQGRLPLCVWAYPLEYNDTSAASQVTGSPFRFSAPRGASQLFLLLCGYAVLDGAAMPVIGDPETVNDTFIEQIVSSASAAIDAAVATGAVDRERVGIGGHSYGAFMTTHLLAHSDLFRAGIARSGAYNRTLTPFGFQAERRTLWEAPDVYVRLSPLLAADKIDEPLLLLHGAADQNSGTFPLQSERLFHAIKGNGGIARHVELPLEGHGYLARESVLHALAEMIDWFDEYVKGKAAPAPQVEASFLEEG